MIKQNIIWIISMICLASTVISASTFNVQTIICSPSWYCTVYSEGSCGTRVCTDINMCGTNTGKPTEYVACESPEDRRSGGSSSGTSIGSNWNPGGYFATDKDFIQITIKPEGVVQKIIKINTTLIGEHNLEIGNLTYNSFITTSISIKNITDAGDFNIIIDTHNVSVGTYVIPVKISNKYYSKTIILSVDVVPDTAKIELYLDSKIKYIGIDNEISTNIRVSGAKLWAGENITYQIIDPLGNIIYTETREILDPSNIIETFKIPDNLGEGYYTLATKIIAENTEYSKSVLFTILTPEKYALVEEMPQQEKFKRNIMGIIALICITTILITTLIFISKRYAATHKEDKDKKIKKPLININLGFKKKPKNIEIKDNPEEKYLSEKIRQRNKILRESYENGFISLVEYSKAIHANVLTEKEKEHLRKEEEKQRAEIEEKRLKEEKKIEEEKLRQEKETQLKKEEEKKKREREEQQKEKERKEQEKTKQIREEKERREAEEKKKEKLEAERKVREEKEALEEQKIREEKLKRELEKKDSLLKKILKKIKEKPKSHVEEKRKGEIEGKVKEEKHSEQHKTEVNPSIKTVNKSEVLDKRTKDQEAFVLNSNELLYSLRDLLKSLHHMDEKDLHHHIKHNRNDFANWIGDVFQYHDIAEEVRKAHTREEIIKILKKYE